MSSSVRIKELMTNSCLVEVKKLDPIPSRSLDSKKTPLIRQQIHIFT